MKSDDGEFFIGYAPPMPRRLARFIKRVVAGLACGVFAWAVAVAAGHVPLEGGTFEFGHPQLFSGTIVERPYPSLRLDESDRNTTARQLLLVAPGKHGADALVSGFEGRHVTLSGTRVRRGTETMIEVEPGTLKIGEALMRPLTTGVSASTRSPDADGGRVTVRGEIVDSKCFLGVMVPGSGKTHKDCASLCVRGGIPPALFVHDRAGGSALLLLTGTSGAAISAQALPFAGEVVEMTGNLQRQGEWLVLRTDVSTWHSVIR